ncbi:hypothetical protein PIB30_077098 [Stylosanthes scabra]|uniref:Uncharacterized protein n=1 Tax=Stylosanthes scabra TaxID=79078 RepID=A0ABU6XNT1_9FABA|nr:hypothetical protein [Stylosanthes scabra]
MASKGKAPAKAPSTRVRGSTSQQQPPLEIQLYETLAHEKRAKTLEERRVIHERTIKLPRERTPLRNRYWQEDGTSCMNQFIGKEGATWWEDPRNLVIPARPKKKILNYEALMWLKLIVCNINPTRHETTLSMEIVLLIYALMMDMHVSLPSVMIYAMNTDPTKSKNHLLLYPMFITKWAQDNNVPRLPGHVILKIPKSQQFFPYGKWREDEEEVAPPVPPPAAPADILAPSTPSSPEPSRRDLMRALRRNEQISQNQQEQRARSAENGDAVKDEDFQSAEATGDASTYAGGESAEDE